MKARVIIKRETTHRFEDENGYARYFAYTKAGVLMSGYDLVTDGSLKEGDYFHDGVINGETRWTKAIGAIGSSITHRGACRPR